MNIPMLRIFATSFILSSMSQSPICQGGTLVSIAPVRDGIIIAADSRSTIGGQFCDQTYKLVEVAGPDPTTASVPGIGIIFERPPAGTKDLCAFIKKARRVMDIEQFAKSWLESNTGVLTADQIRRLGVDSLEQVRSLVRFSPDAPKAYAGNNFYTIVVARYDRKADIRYVGAVGTRFDPITDVPEVTGHAFWEFRPDSRAEVINFGLFEYVSEHVLREGRNFAQEYLALDPGKRRVGDIAHEEAVSALENLLDASSRTTQLVPTPGGIGIGGPTDILLLGADKAPKRIRWKKT
jgi:hypothetical protein